MGDKDAAKAKKLLAEAGYPNGFAMTIHGPNNRYINDAAIAQTIAQFYSRIGIDVKVDTMPSSVYFTRATKLEFSYMVLGWGTESGEQGSLPHRRLPDSGLRRARAANPAIRDVRFPGDDRRDRRPEPGSRAVLASQPVHGRADG